MSRSMMAALRRAAKACREEVRCWRAVTQHPRTPWPARLLLLGALAYLLLPFDLVPDWIPLLGQLDDVLIVGLAVWLAARMVPEDVMNECRSRSDEDAPPAPTGHR